MIRRGIVTSGLGAAFICTLAAATATAAVHLTDRPAATPPTWQKVGDGMTGGVSGMVATRAAGGTVEALVARDNKEPGQSRLAEVRLAPGERPSVHELTWRGGEGSDEPPKDLESLDALPGRPGEYATLSSGDGGKFRPTVYGVAVSGGTATVRWSAPLPETEHYKDDATQNYEAFAVHRDPKTKKYVAVWATRGSNGTASRVRAAVLDPSASDPDQAFGHVTAARPFSAPWPAEDEVRHVSDVKIRQDGTLVLSSAQDPNKNSGPFSSAVYEAGSVTLDHGRPELDLGRPTEVRRFTTADNRKIEAVALLPGARALWGTDDEDFGGSVRLDRIGTGG